MLSDDAIFIGTDATENWNKNNFKSLPNPISTKAKPGTLQH